MQDYKNTSGTAYRQNKQPWEDAVQLNQEEPQHTGVVQNLYKLQDYYIYINEPPTKTLPSLIKGQVIVQEDPWAMPEIGQTGSKESTDNIVDISFYRKGYYNAKQRDGELIGTIHIPVGGNGNTSDTNLVIKQIAALDFGDKELLTLYNGLMNIPVLVPALSSLNTYALKTLVDEAKKNDPAKENVGDIMKEADGGFEDILTMKPENKSFITSASSKAGESHRKYLLGPAPLIYQMARTSWSGILKDDPAFKSYYDAVHQGEVGKTADDIFEKTFEQTMEKKAWPVFSALTVVSQGAFEAGWGEGLKSLNKRIQLNNYHGHMAGGEMKKYSSFGYNQLFHYLMLYQRFPDAIGMYESGKFTGDKLEQVLKSGAHQKDRKSGEYSYDTSRSDYGTFITDSMNPLVLKVWKAVLKEEIACVTSLLGSKPSLQTRIAKLQWILDEINTLKL